MKKIIALSLWVIVQHASAQVPDSDAVKKISDEIFLNGHCYRNLEFLCKKAGPRLSGSLQAQKAVEICRNLMANYGFDTVYLQEVMVPHWERGKKERGKIVPAKGEGKILEKGRKLDVTICALGGSIGTPEKGMAAGVVEVKNFEELKNLGREKVAGKIVFFNRPFDLAKFTTFEMYGGAVDQRSRGAIEAARFGAVGAICRSMTPAIDDFPHTGAMHYEDSIQQIPFCAISTKDAELLSALLKKSSKLKFFMKMNCRTLPDVKSWNVIGEIRGSQFPDEIIAVGGHLDSWDLGEGAHDDGAGCMQAIEILRCFKALGLKPKRTIRAVMWMNEENGLRGGEEYAKRARQKNEKHILAIESDAGGFTPRGFSMTMPEDKKAKILLWKDIFYPYGVYDFSRKGGGADIGPLERQGVPVMGLLPDSQRYFDYHHAATDIFENVNKRELELGAVTMAIMVWMVAEHGF
ncbi:MAG: M20/M25/M40 family metallo-hydrolase [Bacteroidetes bacterium]|nr:M20/M25/M40 family metallo-hydrolase [Bacteroidota bacterium]